jgi:AsmA protein
MAAGFKRLGLAIAGVVAAAFVLLAVGPQFIPGEMVRDAIKREIKSVTGLDVMVRGPASVSMLPWGNVSFSDVVLGGAGDKPALAADQMSVRLRLLPLLFGRIDASDLSLSHARILVSFAADGTSNWSALADKLAHALGPQLKGVDQVTSFSEIRVSDGEVVVHDDALGFEERLSGVEMSLAWPAIARSFGMTGRLVWRGQSIDAFVNIADLAAALAGERAGVKLRLTGAPFKLAFDGHVTREPTVKIEGTLSADAPSLRSAMTWIGLPPPPGGGFGRFALKAHADTLGNAIILSSTNVELDGNKAEGVLAVTRDARPLLQGTLAAEELDFTPYVSTLHLLRAGRDWSPAPFVLEGLSGLDLDLRISARRVVFANIKLGRTGIAANLRDGRFGITIGESQAFGGVLMGTVSIAGAPAGAELKSQLQFSDVDLQPCLSELFGVRRLEGKGALALSVEATGDSVLAFARSLNGSATLTAHQGALTGYNVEELLRRLESRPLSGRSEFRSGRTPFEKLTVNVKLTQGTATVEDLRLEGTAVRLAIGGSASIPARDLDLKGTASLAGATASADSSPMFVLPFVVQGPWDDPVMLPDTDLLLRRSGAAAPLFDTLRQRTKSR